MQVILFDFLSPDSFNVALGGALEISSLHCSKNLEPHACL